jgi:uncharacterized protein (TIGR03084 family)
VGVADRAELLGDLRAEGDRLDAVVAALEDTAWLGPTPAEGWTVAHQIAHLAWTDEQALLAATDPGAFTRTLAEVGPRLGTLVDDAAGDGAAEDPAELLDRWRAGRATLAEALANLPDGTKLPWFGPPMSAASMATARLMETWAHARDVADALGASLPADDRVRHVVHIGVRARNFAFANNGLEAPADEFRVELRLPGGDLLEYGPADAPQSVRGSAHDFALLVTQRCHRDDTDLVAEGPDADRWLDIAQSFAGPSGSGRAPKGTA